MRQRLIGLGAAALLLAALAIGCGKSTPTSPVGLSSADPAQVATTIAQAPDLVDDGLAEDASRVSASDLQAAIGPMGAQAAIRPFAWWQNVTSITRAWSFAWADTDTSGHPMTCVATLSKHMTGSLVIVPRLASDSTQADSVNVIRKPLDKTLTRRVMLQRVLIAGVRRWRVVAVTGAFVTTPGATTNIVSLRLQSTSGVDTTITDPLQWHALKRVVKFTPSDTVTVTVTTSRTNDLVYIHRTDWRHRLRSNGDGTYTFSWVTTPLSGWRFFGIQAMSNSSLMDDTAAYDSQAWHMPFRVAGGQPDVNYYPQ